MRNDTHAHIEHLATSELVPNPKTPASTRKSRSR